jgi:hypothetical protein
MRSVTYSMSVSLDGYIVGPDGNFDWTVPDEVFRFWIDEIREVGVHLMGRRLYETMLYWETADQDRSLDDAELEWAALWKPLPKVVFSTTLSAVQGHARLASGGLAEEIERLRAEPGGRRHRDRRRDARRRGGRVGSDRRVPGYGLRGAGWRWHSVLPPARAPGGSRTRRDPHLQLEGRLPPLPRGALALHLERATSPRSGATGRGLTQSRNAGRRPLGSAPAEPTTPPPSRQGGKDAVGMMPSGQAEPGSPRTSRRVRAGPARTKTAVVVARTLGAAPRGLAAAGWPSGEARVCKTLYTGSIPVPASNGPHGPYNHIARALSSGGERFLDAEEVRGSNPLAPTIQHPGHGPSSCRCGPWIGGSQGQKLTTGWRDA